MIKVFLQQLIFACNRIFRPTQKGCQTMTNCNLDPNLAVNNTVGEVDVRFYDVRQEPFHVYGFYDYRN